MARVPPGYQGAVLATMEQHYRGLGDLQVLRAIKEYRAQAQPSMRTPLHV